MKKTIFYMVPLALMAFVFVLISPVSAGAVASPVVLPIVCPAGYVCTPITPQPAGCPTGYICNPVTPVNNGGGSSGGSSSSGGGSTNSCYNFATNLTIGSTGADVVALQTLLIANGYNIPDISSGAVAKGYYGQSTVLAVSAFQVAKGIVNPGTGFVGPLTRAALNNLSCTNNSTTNSKPIVSNTSATAVLNDNGTSAPTSATITFMFTLTARNSDVFLRKVFPGYLTTSVGATADANLSSASPATLAGDTSNVYVIPAGTSRTFTYTGTLDNRQGTTGLVSVKVNSLLYGMSASSPTAQITDGLERLKTPSMYLVGNSTTPSVTEKPKINNVAGRAAGNFEIDAGGIVGITGFNLAGYKDATNVYIGGKVCTITQLGNDLIYCTAPSDLMIGNIYDLYINTAGIGGDKVTSNIVQVKVLSKVSTTQPSITVLSPKQGGVYDNGSTQNIIVQWNSQNVVADNYYVDLSNTYIGGIGINLKSNVSVSSNGISFQPTDSIINSVVANSGGKTREQIKDSYYVTVVALKNLGNGYSTQVAKGKSGIFTITSPTTPVTPTPITVLTPTNPTTHGDTFSTGETLPLAWSSKEFGVNRIYLLSETGSKIATILATNDNGVFPYTGSTYSWKIPDNIPTGTYKVRVIIGIEGMSTSPVGDSGTFKIRNTSTVVVAQPTITVLSPKNGQSLVMGDNYDISLNSSVSDFSYYQISLKNKYSGTVGTLIASNVGKSVTSYNFKLTADMVKNVVANSSGKTADQIKNDYYVEILAMKPVYLTSNGAFAGYSFDVSGKSDYFTITAPTALPTLTPTPTPSSSPTSSVSQSSLNASIWDAINEYYKNNR